MFCLAVYITMQSGLYPCVCDVSCIIPVFVTCLVSETEIATEYKNKTKFLITELNKDLNCGPDMVYILLGLVLNLGVSFPTQHILNECHDLVH